MRTHIGLMSHNVHGLAMLKKGQLVSIGYKDHPLGKVQEELGFKKWVEADLDNISSMRVIRNAMRNIDWSGSFYNDIAGEELGPDAKDTQLRRKARKIAKEDLEDRYQKTLSHFQTFPQRFEVWREITIKMDGICNPTLEDVQKRIKFQGVGVYWSFDENAAEAHWGGCYETHVAMKGKVSSKDVDWRSTLELNIEPSIGDYEKEIRMKEGAPITITEISFPIRVGNHSEWQKHPVTIMAFA